MIKSLAAILCVLTFSFAAPAAATAATATTLTLPSTCGTSQSSTAPLEAALTSNRVVTLPKNGCFNVDAFTLTNVTNLTVNGNGATLTQPRSIAASTKDAILQLNHDSHLTISNLHLTGQYNGTNGGPKFESAFGVVFEADSNILLNNDTIKNVQGDALYLSPPYDVKTDDALNTSIDVTNSTVTNAGYHGITDESTGCPTLATCDGLTINHDSFTGIAVDAMDFEYDIYSTPFNADHTPFFAAQDNTLIEHSTWSWTDDWFASVQGQKPGVQEQHITLTGNTLNSNAPLFEVSGTNTAATTPPYLNAYLTVTNNAMGTGFHATGYRGGTTPPIQLSAVAGLVLEHNVFPVCSATNGACSTAAYALNLYDINYATIENNDFTGASGTVLPQSFNTQSTHVLVCANRYGFGGQTHDAAVCQY